MIYHHRRTTTAPKIGYFLQPLWVNRNRMMIHLNLIVTLIIFVVVFSSNNVVVTAQERPTLIIDQFSNSTSFRQDICGQQALLDNGTIPFIRDALQGLQLRPVFTSNQFLSLDTNVYSLEGGGYGMLDVDHPGVLPLLMDELADRGGFTWRTSFGVTLPPPPDKTWADLLKWTTETYDISVDWWIQNTQRLALGVNFPEGWYDASVIMVGVEDISNNGWRLFRWLAPFDWTIWFLIIVTVIISGLVYLLLDEIDHKSDREKIVDPLTAIYLASMTFVGHFEMNPRTHAARLLTFSMCFWALLMIAAYTANFVSFLVVEQTPKLNIQTLDDAIGASLPLCVRSTNAIDLVVTKSHPNAQLVRVPLEIDVYKGVLAGDCALALTTINSWQEFERDREVNGSCKLEWIGRPIMIQQAGFATKSDSGTLCTNLIRDVFHLHMLEMKADGFVDRVWEQHLARRQSVNCAIRNAEKDPESSKLTLDHMLGTFILHFVMMVISIVLAFFSKKRRDQEKEKKKQAARLKEAEDAAQAEKDAAAAAAENDHQQVYNDILPDNDFGGPLNFLGHPTILGTMGNPAPPMVAPNTTIPMGNRSRTSSLASPKPTALEFGNSAGGASPGSPALSPGHSRHISTASEFSMVHSIKSVPPAQLLLNFNAIGKTADSDSSDDDSTSSDLHLQYKSIRGQQQRQAKQLDALLVLFQQNLMAIQFQQQQQQHQQNMAIMNNSLNGSMPLPDNVTFRQNSTASPPEQQQGQQNKTTTSNSPKVADNHQFQQKWLGMHQQPNLSHTPTKTSSSTGPPRVENLPVPKNLMSIQEQLQETSSSTLPPIQTVSVPSLSSNTLGVLQDEERLQTLQLQNTFSSGSIPISESDEITSSLDEINGDGKDNEDNVSA